jgi:glycosyltransferase involved in cell wall biosynthesis
MVSRMSTQETELPLVTIMIPTYNQAHFVLEAVDSALAQDYPNLEIIVADDASTDDTSEVVSARRDARIRYHRNAVNLGRVGNYRNTLFNLATGEWVVNLDGDDFLTDSRFVSQAVAAGMAFPNVAAVAAKAFVVGRKGRRVRLGRESILATSGIDAIYDLARGRNQFFHLATLYRRRLAIRSDFYCIDSINSDYESFCRLIVSTSVVFLQREVGVWRVNSRSASASQDLGELVKSLEVWDRVIALAVGHGMAPLKAELSKVLLVGMTAYGDCLRLLEAGNFRGAWHYLRILFRRHGISPVLVLATRWRLYPAVVFGCIARSRGCDAI